MAKKSFEKKAERNTELPSKVYQELAAYREKRYDMERTKHIITFAFVILEALII